MRRSSFVGFLLVLALLAPSASCAAEPDAGRRYPSHVSGYELATREDLLYRHLLDQMITGDDPARWSILGGLTSQVGDWITSYVEAQRIAGIITDAMPIEAQPAVADLDALVADCARILCLSKPLCFVRNLPTTTACTTEVGGRPVLVVSSALLKLYKGRPEELRFIVGRELGHIKCDHIRMGLAANGIVGALRQIDVSAVPDKYQAVLPTLALGRLCSWVHESEISADRAGLLCCQDPEVAYQALLRLLHGLDDESVPTSSATPALDARLVVKEYYRWQERPFVEFLVDLKRSAGDAPFIPERIAALQLWTDTGVWQSILARQQASRANQLLVIKQIGLAGLASSDAPVNPYIVAYDGRHKLFTTRSASQVTSALWKQIEVAHACKDCQPIFFEVWNDTLGSDELLAGFVVYPESRRKKYHSRLIWDWKDRSSTSRAGLAEVQVEFQTKAQ